MELIHQHNWDLENTSQRPQASKEEINTVPDSVIGSLHKAYIISNARCHNTEVYSYVQIQHFFLRLYFMEEQKPTKESTYISLFLQCHILKNAFHVMLALEWQLLAKVT
jgi:hypothetical protein